MGAPVARRGPLRVWGLVSLQAVVAASVQAQGDRRQAWLERLPERFAAADRDGDGRLTREEARAGMPGVYKRFDTLDRAKRGWLTLDELRQAASRAGARP
jgi:Ca2+-binding EF-hand superfamily protein